MNYDTKYICDVIRESVSALEAGRLLGLDPGHDGRCRCPFHGGEHKNMKLYAHNRGFYCFVCHAYGDVIKLVMQCTNGTFSDAIEWLNESFGLGLDTNRRSYRNRLRNAERYARKAGEETL